MLNFNHFKLIQSIVELYISNTSKKFIIYFWSWIILYNIFYINIMKRTFQPNKKKRAKVSGFRKRNSTTKGRKILKARRMKGRAKISSSDER